jgi:hypothetical protein
MGPIRPESGKRGQCFGLIETVALLECLHHAPSTSLVDVCETNSRDGIARPIPV